MRARVPYTTYMLTGGHRDDEVYFLHRRKKKRDFSACARNFSMGETLVKIRAMLKHHPGYL